MSVSDAVAAVLAAAFLAAGVAKARQQFRSENSVLPGPIPRTVVWCVVVVELMTAVTLLVRPRLGAVAALTLLIVFTGALVVLQRRYPSAPCRCFGERSNAPIGIWHYARNLGMMFACLVILLW